MFIFPGLMIMMIVAQIGIAVGVAAVLKQDLLVGMCTGSIPMAGGHEQPVPSARCWRTLA